MSAAFSAVIVARNEEALIARCLESVAWCDERIVVDMDSADRTREHATPLATKIVDHEWIPHMEWARNRGIELATGEWILVVDADEVITDKLAERLRAAVEADGESCGIWLPRLNHCFGRRLPHIGGFPDYQLRCFRRAPGSTPTGSTAAPRSPVASVSCPSKTTPGSSTSATARPSAISRASGTNTPTRRRARGSETARRRRARWR